jgi:hypothetical protein
MLRQDAHAEVEQLTAGSIPAPSHFSNSEEPILDRSEILNAPGAGDHAAKSYRVTPVKCHYHRPWWSRCRQ